MIRQATIYLWMEILPSGISKLLKWAPDKECFEVASLCPISASWLILLKSVARQRTTLSLVRINIHKAWLYILHAVNVVYEILLCDAVSFHRKTLTLGVTYWLLFMVEEVFPFWSFKLDRVFFCGIWYEPVSRICIFSVVSNSSMADEADAFEAVLNTGVTYWSYVLTYQMIIFWVLTSCRNLEWRTHFG